MKSARILILGLGFATALAACSSDTAQITGQIPAQPKLQNPIANPSGPKVLGTINLQVGETENQLGARALTVAGQILVTPVNTGGYPKKISYANNTKRFITYKFAVKNNGTTPVTNLTFVALNRPQGASPTLGGTPIVSITGTNPDQPTSSVSYSDATNARAMIPAHGFRMTGDFFNGRFRDLVTDTQTADLQFMPPIPGYPNALGYGFLAHGPEIPYISAGRFRSRTIDPGVTGDVFINYRVPVQAGFPVSKFTLALVVVSNDVYAASESLEDRNDFFVNEYIASGFDVNSSYFSLGVTEDAPIRWRYTCGGRLAPGYPRIYPLANNGNYYDNMGPVTMAAASGSLAALNYCDQKAGNLP